MPKPKLDLRSPATFLFLLTQFLAAQSRADIKRADDINPSGLHLALEVLSDQVFHFEYAPAGGASAKGHPLPTSLYIAKAQNGVAYQADLSGPLRYTRGQGRIQTRAFEITVQPKSLCFDLRSLTSNTRLTTICPIHFDQAWKGLSFSREKTEDVYGLGEQFLPHRFGTSDGDWVDQVRFPGTNDDGVGEKGKFGNEMIHYPPHQGAAGEVGNNQFPIMYAINDGPASFSLFLDDIYKQRWDFRGKIWKVESAGPVLRGFVTVAKDLPSLRSSFMDLVGHPLVPPKKAFGLWVSEYGFENWGQIDDKLKTLRAHHFPVDGFVMDLQWFGNVKKNSEQTRMGTLEFDTSKDHFPDPATKIHRYATDQGIGLITIEEPYIGRGLKEYRDLAKRGFLVRQSPEGPPLDINENPWWGLGGMMDWNNPAAGAYWHETKRRPLMDLGILGHWTDLGEPEMYRHLETVDQKKIYTTASNEAETHNLYSLLWHESIFKGYLASGSKQRPFILSRSGGPGMQRYGAAMWSGDIGSKFENLATHYGVQMQMSLSGQDYFDSDIGGFHREDLDGDLNELYTQWFADACYTDVPVRPHTENVLKNHETAPDRIGDLDSNLHNIRRRYELSPYYYSLAHEAYLKGQPVIPPIFFYHPTEKDRKMGDEKQIGADLLFTIVAQSGQNTQDVYLPKGDWVDYHTLEWHTGESQLLKDDPLKRDQVFTLPLFARAGAIIPKMWVDDQTMNILGKRLDGVTHTELIARVFVSTKPSQFTLFEDDGTTTGYQTGAVAKTLISQGFNRDKREATVRLAPTEGSYTSQDPNTGAVTPMPEQRRYEVELVAPSIPTANRVKVRLGTSDLPRLESELAYRQAESGYFVKSNHLILAKSPKLSVRDAKEFVFSLQGPLVKR